MNRRRWLIFLFGVILVLFILKALKSFGATPLNIDGAAFSYKPDIDAYYFTQITKLSTQNNGYIDKHQELEIYHKLYQTHQGTHQDLTAWNEAVGTSPQEFSIRLRLYNNSINASHETPVTIAIDAKVGEYYVDTKAFMVDQKHLEKTARWIKCQTIHDKIPMLGSEETYTFYSKPLYFGAYLLSLKHQFPVAIRAKITLSGSKMAKVIEIPVYSDHFALEDLQH